MQSPRQGHAIIVTNMIKTHVTDLWIYRWRYRIGYSLVTLFLLGILIVIGLNIPGGISSNEMKLVVISDNLSLTSFSSDNYPYHLLQHLSIQVFGLSILSIKLVSIIIATLSIVGMTILLCKWYRPNVGILATLIAITTGQFIFIAQNGTPDIMNLFWPVFLILTASLVIHKDTKNKKAFAVLFCILAALSLYTPLSIYTLIAILAASLLHPHLRFHVRNIGRNKLIIGTAIFLVLVSPVLFHIFKDPGYIISLFGIPNKMPDIQKNLSILGSEYLGFNQPGGALYMTPVFELGSIILILIGAYQTFKTRVTAKSYIISLSVVCLIPVAILNPTLMTVTLLPLVILLAAGLRKLLSQWYSLFPFNPYARIGGLIPMVILASVLIISGVNRYVYTYLYSPTIAVNFSRDLALIPKDTKKIVVAVSELEFYNVLAKHNKNIVIDTVYSGDNFITTRLAKSNTYGYSIQRIITDSKKENGARFYLYKMTAK
jgi:hypothetical protein